MNKPSRRGGSSGRGRSSNNNSGRGRNSKFGNNRHGGRSKVRSSFADSKEDGDSRRPSGGGFRKPGGFKPGGKRKDPNLKYNDSDSIRLNKYIANAGICSRREADTLITSGVIAVNGKIVTELGTVVNRNDVVKYGDDTISLVKNRYLLLNKPKDFVTHSNDPNHRRNVIHLVKDACKERLYPVGKLDRYTTGLVLFTNDADLAKVLEHPKHFNKKIYQATLVRNLSEEVLEKIKEGVELDDGFVKVQDASFVGTSHRDVGIEVHSNKHRIVQRIFENFNYHIKKLDRVYYAGLTKKDLPRGRYRFLTEQEVLLLKRAVKKGS